MIRSRILKFVLYNIFIDSHDTLFAIFFYKNVLKTVAALQRYLLSFEILCLFLYSSNFSQNKGIWLILADLFAPKKYPEKFTFLLIVVSLKLTFLSYLSQAFPSDLFFRQRWNDPRLKHNMNRSLVLMMGTKQVPDVIWVPDTVFINSIHSKMHDVTISNNKLDVFPNGDVFWGTR